MNTLAFDTCFGACSVAAFWRDGERRASAHRFERLVRGHAERLMPMIAEVMDEAPFDFAGIARIVVTTGPGTFTGQRVGIAAARALSLATGARVGTLSSLAVMAHGAAHELGAEASGRGIAVAVDARRGEVYFQCFAGPDLAPLGPPELTLPQDAVAKLGVGEAIVVGSGAGALAAEAQKIGIELTARLTALEPDVRCLGDVAVTLDSVAPRPLYLRPPDAKPQERSALGRVS